MRSQGGMRMASNDDLSLERLSINDGGRSGAGGGGAPVAEPADSPSSPPQTPRVKLCDVVALMSMNGFASEVERCVDLCRDTRSNVELWERIVDLPHAVAGHRDAAYRCTRLHHWSEVGDLARVRETLGRGAKVDVRDRVCQWSACNG